jgi:hypothetical protein
MNPKKLAAAILRNLKRSPDGFTIDAETLAAPKPGYLAVGGMIRRYGEFDALLHSPGGAIDAETLEAVIDEHWQEIQTTGYVGAWLDGGELFIDSVLAIPCACESLGGPSAASFDAALQLGRQNNQLAVGHVCDAVGGYQTITLERK